jgi:hypothetical protein
VFVQAELQLFRLGHGHHNVPLLPRRPTQPMLATSRGGQSTCVISRHFLLCTCGNCLGWGAVHQGPRLSPPTLHTWQSQPPLSSHLGQGRRWLAGDYQEAPGTPWAALFPCQLVRTDPGPACARHPLCLAGHHTTQHPSCGVESGKGVVSTALGS